MYSYKERLRAVKLLMQFDMSWTVTRRKLGYPRSETIIRKWYREYQETGKIYKRSKESVSLHLNK